MVDLSDMLTPQVAVLGSMLIDEAVIGRVLGRVKATDFTDPRCRMVFSAIRAQFSAGGPVDPVTVRDRVAADGSADEWGKWIMDAMAVTPTANNVDAYVGLMREQARLCQIRALGVQLSGITEPDAAGAILSELNALQVNRPDIRRTDMQGAVMSFFERHSSPHTYLSWGMPKLDKMLYIELGDMLVLGGYSSAGKTALAINFAWHLAQTYRVGFYSLETNRNKLADRLFADLFEIPMGNIKRGEISEEQWKRAAQRSEAASQPPLHLIEAAKWTVADIQADAVAHRYQVIFVDYLQLIEPQTRNFNRQEEVARISISLHQLAQGNGITVVALSQLSRAERTKGGDEVSPSMSNLRESGQIEQDADAILLLYLEAPDDQDSRRILKVAKNKEGTRGMIYAVFDGTHQRFYESAVDAPAPGGGDIQRRLVDQGKKIKAANHAAAAAGRPGRADSELPF